MYWWYGKTKYDYTPEIVSYSVKPVPEYIRNNNMFQNYSKKPILDNIFVIYERVGDYQTWLTQFHDYCLIEKNEFDWNVTVNWMKKC